jgi:hypothetical protein
LWPHFIAEHWIVYSQRGVETVVRPYGFVLRSKFYPRKIVPFEMIVRHRGLQVPVWISRLFSRSEFNFNIGEMGLIFERGYR